MAGLKELKARIESDKAFAAKFVNVENEAQIIAIAKAEGYDLEQLSDEELDMVAAGGLFGWISNGIKSVGGWVKDNMVDPLVDGAGNVAKKGAETVLDVMGVDDFVKKKIPSPEDFKNIHLTNNNH
ncbi:MAG: Nif11-like leader peptide family natural product precursor [Selenomonadaceae bacterium]|nr:Nif11-like leader peptide family natural product precursor [Selenomonadaceae bacterium]